MKVEKVIDSQEVTTTIILHGTREFDELKSSLAFICSTKPASSNFKLAEKLWRKLDKIDGG